MAEEEAKFTGRTQGGNIFYLYSIMVCSFVVDATSKCQGSRSNPEFTTREDEGEGFAILKSEAERTMRAPRKKNSGT